MRREVSPLVPIKRMCLVTILRLFIGRIIDRNERYIWIDGSIGRLTFGVPVLFIIISFLILLISEERIMR